MRGAGISYVVVSLLTCREPFNLDQLLHRGKYRVEGAELEKTKRPSKLKQFLGFNQDYTRTDKFIALFALGWTTTWCVGFITMLLLNFLVHRWSSVAWFRWSFTKEVWVALAVGTFATTWFTTGGIRDIISLFRSLKSQKIDHADNGMVIPEPTPILSDPQRLAVEQNVAAIEDAGEVALRDK